jgi:hypothetical protein
MEGLSSALRVCDGTPFFLKSGATCSSFGEGRRLFIGRFTSLFYTIEAMYAYHIMAEIEKLERMLARSS